MQPFRPHILSRTPGPSPWVTSTIRWYFSDAATGISKETLKGHRGTIDCLGFFSRSVAPRSQRYQEVHEGLGHHGQRAGSAQRPSRAHRGRHLPPGRRGHRLVGPEESRSSSRTSRRDISSVRCRAIRTTSAASPSSPSGRRRSRRQAATERCGCRTSVRVPSGPLSRWIAPGHQLRSWPARPTAVWWHPRAITAG